MIQKELKRQTRKRMMMGSSTSRGELPGDLGVLGEDEEDGKSAGDSLGALLQTGSEASSQS